MKRGWIALFLLTLAACGKSVDVGSPIVMAEGPGPGGPGKGGPDCTTGTMLHWSFVQPQPTTTPCPDTSQLDLKTSFHLTGTTPIDPNSVGVTVDALPVASTFQARTDMVYILRSDAGHAGSHVDVAACPQ